MPFGAPDFSNIRKEALVHRLDDLAEAAVRTHVLYTFDRQGDIIYFNDFENRTLPAHISTPSQKSRYVIARGAGLLGGNALVLKKDPADTGDFSVILRFPLYSTKTIGFSLLYRRGQYESESVFDFFIRKPPKFYQGRIVLNHSENKLIIWDAGQGKVLHTYPHQILSPSVYQFIKFVINIEKERYERVILGTDVFDAREYKLATGPTADMPHVVFTLQYKSNSTNADIAFYDSIIVTINEPVSD